MKHLYLLRHAKSGWDAPELDDFDRPLAPRGVEACAKMTAHLRGANIAPDMILCSSAVRTRQTHAGIAKAFPATPEVRFERDLYLASPRTMLAHLCALEGITGVMVIAHNPGIQHLAIELAAGSATPHLADMQQKFPTLGLACFDIHAATWSEVAAEVADLRNFVIPRHLKSM